MKFVVVYRSPEMRMTEIGKTADGSTLKSLMTEYIDMEAFVEANDLEEAKILADLYYDGVKSIDPYPDYD